MSKVEAFVENIYMSLNSCQNTTLNKGKISGTKATDHRCGETTCKVIQVK